VIAENAEGVTIQYRRIPVGDHVTVAVQGALGALAYVHDRLAGSPRRRAAELFVLSD
jgi:hypothetical protein